MAVFVLTGIRDVDTSFDNFKGEQSNHLALAHDKSMGTLSSRG